MITFKIFSWIIPLTVHFLHSHASPEIVRTLERHDGHGMDLKNMTPMRPVRMEDIYPHLRKRVDDMTKLEMQEKVRLVWALSDGNETAIADMRLKKPDPNHPLLLLESFDDLTDSIECCDRAESIVLKFKHNNAMDAAVKAWDWVNEQEPDYFFLIANHDGCGPDLERVPYKVVSVKYDNLTAILTTKTTTWEEAAQTFDMWIGGGSQVLRQPRYTESTGSLEQFRNYSSELEKRLEFPKLDPVGWIVETVVGVKKVIFGVTEEAVNFVKTAVSLLSGSPVDMSLVANPGKQKLPVIPPLQFDIYKLSITCEECYSKGAIQWDTKYSMVGGILGDLTIRGRPRGVSGKISFATEIEADTGKGFTKEHLQNLPVNPLGVSGIFVMGYALSFGAGVEAHLAARGAFTMGLEWSFPDAASLEIHSPDVLKSAATGWDATEFKPSFSLDKLNCEGSLTGYLKLRGTLGLEALGKSIGARFQRMHVRMISKGCRPRLLVLNWRLVPISNFWSELVFLRLKLMRPTRFGVTMNHFLQSVSRTL
ncbi:hypothetical protein TWF694_001172 [Orbilia ellipsospora]|uniref:DUF7029 domain-containing protein n=1 Tax=Orbilia ellipsospora TaxID=2528407 RepID=A0AAV9XR11_9PEZI